MYGTYFTDGKKFDKGITTSIAISNNNIVVEVHKSQNHDTLWYHLGEASAYGVNWKDSHKYDTGVTPSIAVNNFGIVVEVHKSENNDSLWYHLGKINGDTIDWSASYKYDTGKNPSVAITDEGLVVEVHKSQNHDTLWCNVGQISKDNVINWLTNNQYDKGKNPSVAITNDGLILEVHKSQNNDTLWYNVGQIGANNIINWLSNNQYDKGKNPSITINNAGMIIEVHKSENNDTLWSHTGKINGTSIEFDKSVKFDTGINPSVACNEELAIQAHESETADTLWYSTTLLVDHARWMEYEEGLAKKMLWEVTLPGSHDSGTYSLSDNIAPKDVIPEWVEVILNITKYISLPTFLINNMIFDLLEDWGEAQEQNIEGQLNGGIRYFDLRPCYYKNDFYIYHGLIGPKFSDILKQAKKYLQSVSKELIILNVSHFNQFDSSQHEDFIQLINNSIGDYLYKSNNSNLLTTTIGEYVAAGPRVLLIYQNDYVETNPTPGFWRTLDIFDEYSNTPNFTKMRNDQLNKLQDNYGNKDQLFLLSWTLTPNNDTIKDDALDRLNLFTGHSSLHKLSTKANSQLASFLQQYAHQYKINVLYTDFFGDYNVADYAIDINRKNY